MVGLDMFLECQALHIHKQNQNGDTYPKLVRVRSYIIKHYDYNHLKDGFQFTYCWLPIRPKKKNSRDICATVSPLPFSRYNGFGHFLFTLKI